MLDFSHDTAAKHDVVLGAARRLSARLTDVEKLLGMGDAKVQLLVDEAFCQFLASAAELQLVGRGNYVPSLILWQENGEQLTRGWLQNRAREKPRGFAGDNELLGRIISSQLCEDPLGRLFDSFFQRSGAPQAVRNRTEIIATEIVERCRSSVRPQRVVVVGCGPALDVESAVQQLSRAERDRLSLGLLDYDPLAIDAALARLGMHMASEQLAGQAAALFRIPKRPGLAASLAGADLLVSAGMFDYLEAPAAATMLKVFWESLLAGGKLLVFNFSPANTSRAYMEWFGNWYLLYRTEQDLRELALAAGIPPDCILIGAEPLGIDLWLSATKPHDGRRAG